MPAQMVPSSSPRPTGHRNPTNFADRPVLDGTVLDPEDSVHRRHQERAVGAAKQIPNPVHERRLPIAIDIGSKLRPAHAEQVSPPTATTHAPGIFSNAVGQPLLEWRATILPCDKMSTSRSPARLALRK